MVLDAFHPAVRDWFTEALGEPTEPQQRGWPSIVSGAHTLIAAPTGSGKTLAAFMCGIDRLVRLVEAGQLEDRTYLVYVSPLKALGNDIEKNLRWPLTGILHRMGRDQQTLFDVESFDGATVHERTRAIAQPSEVIRVGVRTGDTSPKDRAKMVRKAPHVLVTTPESLYLLLTSANGRAMLRGVESVIIDEIHALVGNKRGAHLALSLERLERLAGGRVQRIGLSATQKPIERVAKFLVGGQAGVRPPANIVDVGHRRSIDLQICVPDSPLEAVMSHEVWSEVFAAIADAIHEHRTTLVFVNSRRMAERVAHQLEVRIGEATVTSHHGSLSREHRLGAEERLKRGELRALVATASLELGIDVGDVDLVIQIGSVTSVATLLQRVGRSGHWKGGLPKGRIYPLTRDELVQSVALLDCVARGELDEVQIPSGGLDVLAQQIVAELAAHEEVSRAELISMCRDAWPYQQLSDTKFDEICVMLSEGFAVKRGRRAAYLHHDTVNDVFRPRRSARLAALTSGGAIPDNFDYEVRLDPEGRRVGTVNEDWAIESQRGDIFQLGNASYRLLKVEPGVVHVTDAHGEPPTIPFWLGEGPTRSDLVSFAVHRLRTEFVSNADALQARLVEPPTADSGNLGLHSAVVQQLIGYLEESMTALGTLPTQARIVVERFFDETESMHMVVHSPYGARVNRGWGLALRKRFCRSFNVELQAAATDDAIVLSLGPMHSFPLEDVFQFLRPAQVRDVLIQAMLDAPMFQTRWRWNATRALAVLRFNGGKKVPPQFQRSRSEDLLALCFPDQVACLENIVGEREIPDHPLVAQTIDDCLTEAMDIRALERLIHLVSVGEVELVAKDVILPSPLSAEVVNSKPYAFLDDAPLEERRTQAVMTRRAGAVRRGDASGDISALDQSAIDRVRADAWLDPRDREELHDALVLQACVSEDEIVADEPRWNEWFDELVAAGRATRFTAANRVLWLAVERVDEFRLVFGASIDDTSLERPILRVPESLRSRRKEPWTAQLAVREIVRSRLDAIGPATVSRIADAIALPHDNVTAALAELEGEGAVLRGRFEAHVHELQWCERRLLARIHRETLDRLRREIQPVPFAVFTQFTFEWQHVAPEHQVRGIDGLRAVLDQLSGIEVGVAAWEGELLRARVYEYDPEWLDSLCLRGEVRWSRRAPSPAPERMPRLMSQTPLMLMKRSEEPSWLARPAVEALLQRCSGEATTVYEQLNERGASFLPDLASAIRLPVTRVEVALGELAAAGLVTSDGFAGVRGISAPERDKRKPSRGRESSEQMVRATHNVLAAGRWSVVNVSALVSRDDGTWAEGDVERIAWQLLHRWGVVFRAVLERERSLPPWRELLYSLRRFEARGEVRGGRFVDGLSGEQFALPNAIPVLRRIRRDSEKQHASMREVIVSAVDPSNVAAVIDSAAAVTSVAGNRVFYQDGVAIAVREAGEVRFLREPPSEDEQRRITHALGRMPRRVGATPR